MRRPVREQGAGATDAEWRWLTAAPGHNGFIGFGATRLTTPGRLARLWAEHADEIRKQWGAEVPALPFGHPAAD